MELNNVLKQNSKDDLTNPLQKELYFLIAKFLSGGPCQRASQALIEELESNEIIPKSVNWLGKPITQDYRTFSSKFEHINPDHLPKLLDQLIKTINAKELASSNVASRSLLSYSTLSLVSKPLESVKKSSGFSWSKKYGQNLLLRPLRERKTILNPVQAILERPVSGCGVGSAFMQPEFYKRLGISCNTLCHLSAVYCVLFDVTGKYIFTGADDHLVKIWSAIDGRLLSTLRGTQSEISDLAVNYENTLLAVASCDKMIRVWCLRTCAPVTVLHGHSGNVTSIFFCPIPRSRSVIRYLASTSTDGSCAFWAYTDDPGERFQFQSKPTLYLERMRPGHAQMICSSFSSGGIFMAAGSADNHVRIYYMLATDGPERILEVEHHKDRVDSISWAHEGLRFVSGSKDGTALVWRFENSYWRYTRLYCGTTPPGETALIYEDPKRRPRVTMVAWNKDDTLVLTAVSDFTIKVWDPKSGELIRSLKEHTNEAYVIESHPINPRIICTAGHDGKLIIWDIGTTNKEDKGEKVYEYYNRLPEGQGHGAVFDCKWAPDGLSLAATDSHGHLMIFTTDDAENSKFRKLPAELFFHTDYRPITRDAISNEIVDEQTQVPPHLMPPPFLVDVDGNPYPPKLQRLVPGRENVREEYLVPNVALSAGGYQEVIEGLPARSNIDEMIHQLAIEQGLSNRNQADRRSGEPPDGAHRGVGLRRSGEVEGVRQSRGEWQTGNYGFPKRHIIPGLSNGSLDSSENHRLGCVEFEEKWYREHLTKTSPVAGPGYVANSLGSPLESPGGRSRRIRRLALQAAERRRQQANTLADFSQLEGVARPNPRPQMEISVSQEAPRRPPTTPRRNVNVTNRRARPVRYDVRRILRSRGESDIENVELDDSSSEANVDSTSSESSEDSDSDWGGTLGNSRSREQDSRKRQSEGRKRSQRVNSNSSPSPEREETHRESEALAEDDEPRPGPSTENTSIIKTETVKQSRPRKARGKVDYSGGLEEIPEQYRPCEWLAEVFPKRSPYFPQLGDNLVYYRQGHEAYIKEVETKNIYEIPKKLKKSLPYVQKPDLEPEVAVRVVGIKYELEPPRLVALKLARTDWNTHQLIHEHLYVKYHDAVNVVDFLILRQMYDKSIRHKWNKGDRFRCLIQRNWWLGTIETAEPFDEKFPDSKYLSYKVKWDSGEPETMSPWDMDIIPDDFEIPADQTGNDGIPASEEDLRIGLYEVTNSDWPPHGHQDAQCQKLSNLLEQVMGLAISEAFLTPVDLNLYPDYSIQIEYPNDLSTIKARLDNRFYRRIDALKFDVSYIALNAEKFNKLDSDIVRHARVIRDVCLEIIANPDIPDINPVYHNIMRNSKKETTDTRPTKSKSKSRSSTRVIENVKRDRNGITSSSKQKKSGTMRLRGSKLNSESDSEDRTWQEQCLDLLNKMWHCKDAAPFREPVDIIDYQDYYQVIDTPMDLQTCREELLGGNYESVQEFHKDMQMIFANSKLYNTDQRSSIYIMTIRLQSMYECQIKSILNKRRGKHKKSSPPASPTKRSRYIPSRAASASANSTPRKNPKRSAAVKNPYVHKDEESSEEEEVVEETRTLRSRANSKRRKMTQTNGHANASRINGHRYSPQRNGHSSPRGPLSQSTNRPNRPRPVKRFRISSGESHQSQKNSPKRASSTRNTFVDTPSTSKRHRIPIKDEPESDEFEDSEEATMPTLNKVKLENDDDYSLSEHDSDDDADDHVNVRRSTRVKRRRGDESDDNYSYGTRFRGKHVKSYAEAQDGTDEENEGRFGKRRRVVPRGSPTRSSRNGIVHPPILRRTARISSDESQQEDDVDPDAPGPSSRLTRRVSSQSQNNLNGRRVYKSQRIRNALEEDEDQQEASEDESSAESSVEDDGEEEEQQSHGMRRGPTRRSIKKQHLTSDEDEYVSSPSRKAKIVSSSSRRSTRGNRPDYAEDSDSEPRITVSSRGRIRKTKSFLGD